MRVVVSLDHHFISHNGNLFAKIVFFEEFWNRYLEVFEHVTVLARAKKAEKVPEGYRRVNGKGVDFIELPDFVGPSQALMNIPRFFSRLEKVAGTDAAFILRVPGMVSSLLYFWLRLKRRPYAVEVIGDPDSSIKYTKWESGAVHASIKSASRAVMVGVLRQQCRRAIAASYVTGEVLQKMYPPGERTFSTSYSSISITKDSILSEARRFDTADGAVIVNTATMNANWKGQEVLIRAFQRLASNDKKMRLLLIGDGRNRSSYEALARSLGVDKQITFTGMLDGFDQVRAYLDKAHIFVFPSLGGEGLPRAVIEAMARGLPCVATPVGGITELLRADDMVPPGDHVKLADKIGEVLGSPRRMSMMSARNIEVARGYTVEIIQARRAEFYRFIKDHLTEGGRGLGRAIG